MISPGYTKRAVFGFGWASMAKIISTGIVVFKVGVAARILSPSDVGLFSLTTIALGLMEAFTETGINLTILQAKESVNYFLNTAWVISIGRGLLIGVLMMMVGLGMQQFYQEPQLLWLVTVASFIPVIKGLINPSIISFHKKMNFAADSSYRVSLTFVDMVAAVTIVWLTHSVFGLVFGMLVAAVYEVLLSFIILKQRPRFEFITSRAKTIFRNARGLTLSSALDYLNENADNLLIGKQLGTAQLGIYHYAYTYGHKSYDLTSSVHHSTLPVYVAIHEDKKRLRQAFFKTASFTLAGLSLLSLPLLLFPNVVVMLLLGDQWLAVTTILPLLTLAGLFQSFYLVCKTLFFSTKRYSYVNASLLLSVTTLLTGLALLGPRFGLEGAVLAVFLSRISPLPIMLFGLYDVLDLQSLLPSNQLRKY